MYHQSVGKHCETSKTARFQKRFLAENTHDAHEVKMLISGLWRAERGGACACVRKHACACACKSAHLLQCQPGCMEKGLVGKSISIISTSTARIGQSVRGVKHEYALINSLSSAPSCSSANWQLPSRNCIQESWWKKKKGKKKKNTHKAKST